MFNKESMKKSSSQKAPAPTPPPPKTNPPPPPKIQPKPPPLHQPLCQMINTSNRTSTELDHVLFISYRELIKTVFTIIFKQINKTLQGNVAKIHECFENSIICLKSR